MPKPSPNPHCNISPVGRFSPNPHWGRFFAKKALGQNFLFDKNVLNKIITALNLKSDETVLEIGAGLGGLTALLGERAKEVIAVEIDKQAVAILKDKFSAIKNIRIVNEDFLKYDIPKKFRSGNRLKVAGNIPYYITSPIIERLFKFRASISEVFLTVQKEVAERMVALPGTRDWSALTCFVRYYAKVKILFKIKPGSFRPAPKVESAFLKLEFFDHPPFKAADEEFFFKMIKAAFNQRRKTFINALSPLSSKEKTALVLNNLGIKPDIRAEDIALADLVKISDCLKFA